MATTKKTASRKTAPAVAVAEVGEVKLEEIVAATLDASRGFIYTSTAIHGPLIEAGLVEVEGDCSAHLYTPVGMFADSGPFY